MEEKIRFCLYLCYHPFFGGGTVKEIIEVDLLRGEKIDNQKVTTNEVDREINEIMNYKNIN